MEHFGLCLKNASNKGALAIATTFELKRKLLNTLKLLLIIIGIKLLLCLLIVLS